MSCVKDKVMGPDYDGYYTGSWSGEIIAFGTFVQITDCRYCGRAGIPFPARIMAEERRLELEAMGSLAGIAENEVEAVRQRAERRQRGTRETTTIRGKSLKQLLWRRSLWS